ncbi:alkaline phosphatase D family protein [Granulosicoccus sp. 3-233]|uniref:alkaline phosphatase D family protein n=1 Tax=Granulosicoccus sp. 3-233 TaxID=3417969 RepID=UPI003D358F74
MSRSIFLPARRRLLKLAASSSGALAAGAVSGFPSISRASARPVITHGVQSGDVSANSGVIWARTDRPARMLVEVSSNESFTQATALAPTTAMPGSDFAVKRLLNTLPADQEIFYRVRFADLQDSRNVSEAVTGHFRTAPSATRDIRFAWSGDTAGQGWGIDKERGGMQTYATMAAHDPDFFIHSGDTIYADGPISATAEMPDGSIWNSLVAEGVEKVAETLDEYRGRYKYNMLDEHVRAFNQQVPVFYQWDDHEVVNNWSAAKDLTGDDRYTEKSIMTLASRSAQAFHEMTPISYTAEEPGRVYRKLSYGPLLDVFFLDLRSYRGPNTEGMQSEITDESRILGAAQLAWLRDELAHSTATWKVIASDMPLGLVVWDKFNGENHVEAVANGNSGKAAGRELEFAELLRWMRDSGIDNVVWLTADVHYTAAHHYHPDRASFQEFTPFWEFVSGPLHAGTFGPNELDGTFGPEVRYVKAPTADQGVNLPPSMGLQFFGLVDIDGQSRQLTVRLMDRDDTELYKVTLDPVAA